MMSELVCIALQLPVFALRNMYWAKSNKNVQEITNQILFVSNEHMKFNFVQTNYKREKEKLKWEEGTSN